MAGQSRIDALTDDGIRALQPGHPEGPGCAVAILREGGVDKTFFHGLASVENGDPIGPTRFFELPRSPNNFFAPGS